MTCMKKMGTVILCAVVTVFLVQLSPATAEEGFYLGGQLPVNMIQGDFDGLHMPSVDMGAGLGLIVGQRFLSAAAVEIDWSFSRHTSGDATIDLGELSLNGKLYVNAPSTTEFYLYGGIGLFTLGDNSLLFSGSGYNLGLGLDHYLTSRLSMGIAAIRKIITYNRIEKSEQPATLVGTLNGDTNSIRFDLTYHF